jgi:sulfoxide reductase heme-binding subunit YedZ
VGPTASTALWYASRSTGVVALVLLTVVIALGILVSRQRSLPGLPRFATTSLHRSLSLLAVAFVAVHVVTAIADPYVTISIAAAIVPFASAYKTLWLGLGAVSIDLIVALVTTSLLRARIGRRTWRAVHWLSYAVWPVALAHSFGSSTDLRHGYLLWLAIGCAGLVLTAACWRLADAVTAARPQALPARVLAEAEQASADHARAEVRAEHRRTAGVGAR